MKCPKCGANNPDNGEFCNSCGAGLKGKLNPALHKDAKAEFIAEIKKIYIQHDITVKNVQRPAKVNEYISLIEQEKAKAELHKGAPMDTSLAIIFSVCLVFVGVFSLLIPGINFGNEEFRFLSSNYYVSLWMSCTIGLVPTLICVIIGLASVKEMTVGKFFGLLIATPAVGYLFYLLICIIRNTIAIILAIIVFIGCVILIITSITGSDKCKAYGETQNKIREYERAIDRHRQDCYDDLMAKYRGILPDKEMESCIPVYELDAITDQIQHPEKYNK